MARRARIPAPGTPVDPLFAAYDALVVLGHTPMRIGSEYECWRCDRVGRIDGAVTTGLIFEEKCR